MQIPHSEEKNDCCGAQHQQEKMPTSQFIENREKADAVLGCCGQKADSDGVSQQQPVTNSPGACCSHGHAHGQSNTGYPSREPVKSEADSRGACQCAEKNHVRTDVKGDINDSADDQRVNDKDCCS
jgi:hypothetical protein